VAHREFTTLQARPPEAEQNGRACTRCSHGSGVGEGYADSFGHSNYGQPEVKLGHGRRATIADRYVILERAVQIELAGRGQTPKFQMI